MNEITPLKSKAWSWGEQIKAQSQGRKSIRVFCEEQKLNWHTFYYWKRKLNGLRGRFIPISRTIHLTAKTPRIHLPNGVQIELGAGLESGVVSQFLRGLCGVNNPPAVGRRQSAKP